MNEEPPPWFGEALLLTALLIGVFLWIGAILSGI